MKPFQFNTPVDRGNHRALARTLLDEHLALVAERDLQLRREDDGIRIETRTLRTWRCGEGPPVETTTLLTRTTFDVATSREQAFALVGDPTRSTEWDPLDRGHDLVEAFDDDHLVMRTLSKPPAPWRMRECLFFMVMDRPGSETAPWVHCARSATHPERPPTAQPRLLQQVFGWSVEPRGPAGARITALATVPENLLPRWLMNAASVRGWLGLGRKVRAIVQATV